jgi:hypothetical protein
MDNVQNCGSCINMHRDRPMDLLRFTSSDLLMHRDRPIDLLRFTNSDLLYFASKHTCKKAIRTSSVRTVPEMFHIFVA